MRRLGANLEKELDFRIEAQNALRLQKCMANNPCIAVPESIPQVSLQDLQDAGNCCRKVSQNYLNDVCKLLEDRRI